MEKYENIIFEIEFDEELIQACAESTIGRELTDLELYRLKRCWYDFDSVGWLKNDVISSFIEETIKIKNSWADEEYYNEHKYEQKN